MRVVWSEEAVLALVALEINLAGRYSQRRASEIIDELVGRVDLLTSHPQLGRMVPEYGQWQLRELFDNWNRVLYRLRPDEIEIVTIVPARVPFDVPENG